MRLFDAYVVVDWSARSEKAPAKPCPDAIWVGEYITEGNGGIARISETFWQTRSDCLRYLRKQLLAHKAKNQRVFLGFDFACGYPAGFAKTVGFVDTARPWRRVWSELERRIEDHSDSSNNRFEVAAALNSRCQGSMPGPFWGCPAAKKRPVLSPKGTIFPYQVGSGIMLERLRQTEQCLRGVQEVWKLLGDGAVGSQTLLGIPAVAKLRDDPELQHISQVWPFETGFALEPVPPGTPFILHAEIWPGVVKDKIDKTVAILDQAEVRAMVNWVANLDASGKLLPLFGAPAGLSSEKLDQCIQQEGWILGAGL